MKKALCLASVGVLALLFSVARAQATGPTVSANVLVDQDHDLLFSQNKQNENAITRDPFTGVLIAGANDEIGEPLCRTPTTPLTTPCPFAPSVSVNGYYRSTDGGSMWS